MPVDRHFVVLLYHRITRSAGDFLPSALDCAWPTFQDHLRLLQHRCAVISLDEACERLADGRLPERAVVLTFDDCWRENMETVAEVLARTGLTGTFFIPTDDIGRDTLNPNHCFYYLFGVAGPQRFAEAFAALIPSSGSVKCPSVATYRLRWDAEARLGYPMASEAGCRFLADLAARLGILVPSDLAATLYMRQEDVRRLSRCGIDVGNHTQHHLNLAELNEAEQYGQIVPARRYLQGLSGQAVRKLAYPYGRLNAASVSAAQAAGHDGACTVAAGTNDSTVNAFHLRRIDAAQMSAADLTRTLVSYGCLG